MIYALLLLCSEVCTALFFSVQWFCAQHVFSNAVHGSHFVTRFRGVICYLYGHFCNLPVRTNSVCALHWLLPCSDLVQRTVFFSALHFCAAHCFFSALHFCAAHRFFQCTARLAAWKAAALSRALSGRQGFLGNSDIPRRARVRRVSAVTTAGAFVRVGAYFVERAVCQQLMLTSSGQSRWQKIWSCTQEAARLRGTYQMV